MAILKNKTESVKLISRVESGVDGFGRPKYTETEVEVSGILVEVLGSQDVLSGTDLSGKKASYKLHIPKGDTHTWEYAKVKVRGRLCQTSGLLEEWVDTPLDWNKSIKAEAYE